MVVRTNVLVVLDVRTDVLVVRTNVLVVLVVRTNVLVVRTNVLVVLVVRTNVLVVLDFFGLFKSDKLCSPIGGRADALHQAWGMPQGTWGLSYASSW